MKKRIIFILVVLMVVAFIFQLSQNGTDTGKTIPEKAIIIKTNKLPTSDVVLYGLNDYSSNERNLHPVTIVNDIQQLNDLRIAMRMVYDCDFGDNSSINNTVKRYDLEFFKNRKLIVMPFTEESSSNIISFDHIEVIDTLAQVYIKRTVSETGSCDLAHWLMFLEIDANFYQNIENFEIVLI